MRTEDHSRFIEVVERVARGSRLLRAWDLEGGVSARTVAIEFERPDGEVDRAVVRLHGEVDRTQNPDVAADEYRLLEIVQSAGIPAPTSLLLDGSCDVFEIPYLVVSFVEGSPDFEPVDIIPNVEALAQQLARIHLMDLSNVDLSFLPARLDSVRKRLDQRPDRLDEALSEGRIREELSAAWPPPAVNQPRLLHGDYWPGNILWRDGELVAVIDWEDAATGDPLADVGNCRLEILWALGEDAMAAFTDRYQSLMPSLDYVNLRFWDLYAALHPAGKLSGWGLDADTEARMVSCIGDSWSRRWTGRSSSPQPLSHTASAVATAGERGTVSGHKTSYSFCPGSVPLSTLERQRKRWERG
ncbi:MAG: phosphotransferase [Thermomicrobiales bacterium]